MAVEASKRSDFYRALGKKLEALRDKAERGPINSVEFLKELIQIAKDTP